ncbi:MAG: hypothetical protein GY765_16250 [bacterium]|nr:hypothetical protein [bacterium]
METTAGHEKNEPGKEKMYLWFSKTMAGKGRLFFVPSKDVEPVKCTAITRDLKPPTNSSTFIIDTYLSVV